MSMLVESVEELGNGEVRATFMEPAGVPVKRGRDWYVPVTYTLEDGRKVESSKGRYSTKKAAVAASEAREVTNVKVIFRNGEVWGTSSTFRIGG